MYCGLFRTLSMSIQNVSKFSPCKCLFSRLSSDPAVESMWVRFCLVTFVLPCIQLRAWQVNCAVRMPVDGWTAEWGIVLIRQLGLGERKRQACGRKSATPFILGRGWLVSLCVRLLSCRNAQPQLLWEVLEQAWVPSQTNEMRISGVRGWGLGIKCLKSSAGDFEKQLCLKTAVPQQNFVLHPALTIYKAQLLFILSPPSLVLKKTPPPFIIAE